MSQVNRLKKGGLVDRKKKLNFFYDGRKLSGYKGDTLASALLANDVFLVGRSFKYHRPRGILTKGFEEPNALVQLESGDKTEPNIRATQQELYDGLRASSQNCWPSVNFDLGSINDVISSVFPAGFYYKTFMWPPSFWLFYEKFIRKAAGLGVAPQSKDTDRYDNLYEHCDVLIAGGGPAGISAALACARSGLKTILAEDDFDFGGCLLTLDREINGQDPYSWIKSSVNELKLLENVTLLPRTTVTAYYNDNYLTAVQRITNHYGPNYKGNSPRERLWKIRARHVILAQGSIERPLIFQDNDRPGIFMASAAHTYLKRFAVNVGKRIFLVTNNDYAYESAFDHADEGSEVTIVDVRDKINSGLNSKVEKKNIKILLNHSVTSTVGRKRIRGITVRPMSPDKAAFAGSSKYFSLDALLMSGGYLPSVHLFTQSKGKLSYSNNLYAQVPSISAQKENSVGGSLGVFSLSEAMSESYKTGLTVSTELGYSASPIEEFEIKEEGAALSRFFFLPGENAISRRSKQFLDFQNDVTLPDIRLAQNEGYISVEHTKRYTTTGMATDQGKLSNMNALEFISDYQKKSIDSIGHTTYRPPFIPIKFGTMAGLNIGELFDPVRKTPIHYWHEDNNAIFEDVGQWKRPRYYTGTKETMFDAVNRECLAVRKSVGILDASTLGKIDIQGSDCVKFLNKIYTNAWDKLKIGSCRYGLMCNEHGMVFDDGVTTRISENHFHMTTTTGGAARVLGWLEEYLQTEWLDMQVYCTSVTDQWTVMSISGPNSRNLLSDLTDMNLSKENFPPLTMRETKVAGVIARIFRISFTGELGYEINVPARYGLHVWKEIIAKGKKYSICPYGTESMHVLRAEKGFVIVGQDTDGSVTPMDLGLNWMVSKKKKDFIGLRSFSRTDTKRKDRKQLVGLQTKDLKTVLPEGSHVVENLDQNQGRSKTIGHVTSSYYSSNLNKSIALAMLKKGQSRMGEKVYVPVMGGKTIETYITDPVFYDKEGEKMNG